MHILAKSRFVHFSMYFHKSYLKYTSKKGDTHESTLHLNSLPLNWRQQTYQHIIAIIAGSLKVRTLQNLRNKSLMKAKRELNQLNYQVKKKMDTRQT